MLKPKFNNKDIDKLMKIRMAAMEQVIINRLIFVGEQFVADARTNHTYLDQTGNLTSSIGYIVLNLGKTVEKNVQEAPNGSDKATGTQTANALLNKLKSDYSSGYTLIVVAGMDYAAAVESKGKNVLTGSVPAAKATLARLFKKN